MRRRLTVCVCVCASDPAQALKVTATPFPLKGVARAPGAGVTPPFGLFRDKHSRPRPDGRDGLG